MAQVIEVPGMGNVEFPDDMNESDIADAIDNHMSQQANANAPVGNTAAAAAAPAGMYGPTGINTQAIKEVVNPLYEAGKTAVGNYVKNPMQGIVDYGAVHLGLPPPYATGKTLKGLGEVYQGAKEAIGNIGKVTGALPEEARGPFNAIFDRLNPTQQKDFAQLIQSKGPAAVTEFKIPANLANDTAFTQAVSELKGMAPTMTQKAGAIAGPVLKAVGKVAGPAGMAYNLYQGGEMARQTQLGQRLAEGQAQIAPQLAQNMQLNTNTSGYQPTAQEAANLLQSGDQRTQAIYGGVQRLQQLRQQQDAQANAVLSQPPTAQNFMARMQALAHKYGTAMPNL